MIHVRATYKWSTGDMLYDNLEDVPPIRRVVSLVRYKDGRQTSYAFINDYSLDPMFRDGHYGDILAIVPDRLIKEYRDHARNRNRTKKLS